jgi:GPH family glycoside/pentoside/hexuronide:cation symporter
MRLKLIYGAPSFAGAALGIPIFVFMPKFYADDVGAPLGFLALAIALARAFDAITDPLMGWLSDRTRSSWGRRRPWLAVGAPLCALAAFALFAPPMGIGPNLAALWFAASFALYFLFHTVYEIPYQALGPELTLDYHERSSLFGWRTLFMLLGQVFAGVLFMVLPPLVGGARPGFMAMGAVYAVLLVGLYALLISTVRERPEFAVRAANPLVPGVRRALRNQPFRILLFSYMVTSLTAAVPGVLAPFFIEYVLRPENPDAIIGLAIPVYIGSGAASIPLWVWAAKRFGKRSTWLFSFWIGIFASVGIFFLGEGDTWLFLLLILVTGTGNGSALLHPSMQADIIDYDELHTGKRREAQYSSFWAMVPKFIAIPSAALPLAILAQLGYLPNQEQSPQVILAMKAIFLAPAAVSFIGWLIALRFPMTEEVHRAVLAGIAAHQRGEAAEEPIRGGTLPPVDARGVDEDTGWLLDHFSAGELRRMLRRGSSRLLVLDVLVSAALSLAVCALLVGWVIGQVGDPTGEPGVAVTFAVVFAGLALSGFCFHMLRIAPARRLRGAEPAPEVLRAQLETRGVHVAR